MTDVVVVTADSDTVVVGQQDTQFVVINQSAPSLVELIAQGPQGAPGAQGAQGPQGAVGDTTVGGFPVSLSSISTGDLLEFSSTTWINRRQENLTDGGNF